MAQGQGRCKRKPCFTRGPWLGSDRTENGGAIMRWILACCLALSSACAAWDSGKNLDALDDQELEALCAHFYDLAGGEPRDETCTGVNGDVVVSLGDREDEIAACKAQSRPACATHLLEACVESRNGSLCDQPDSEACRTYVDCALGS